MYLTIKMDFESKQKEYNVKLNELLYRIGVIAGFTNFVNLVDLKVTEKVNRLDNALDAKLEMLKQQIKQVKDAKTILQDINTELGEYSDMFDEDTN